MSQLLRHTLGLNKAPEGTKVVENNTWVARHKNTIVRILPLLYFLTNFIVNKTPDNGTCTACVLAVVCFGCINVLENFDDPQALILGNLFIFLVMTWQKLQPSNFNDHMLPIWFLFLQYLRDACMKTPITRSA